MRRRLTTKRFRHPYDKGDPFIRWFRRVAHEVLSNRSWRKHPMPFNKTRRGEQRKREREFITAKKQRFVTGLIQPAYTLKRHR